MFSTNAATHDLCSALLLPNSLLLNRFSKIKLKKDCIQNSLPVEPQPASKRSIGCYYKIPQQWANTIDYVSLGESGLMLRSKNAITCPWLTYKDFEVLTFKGVLKINNVVWKTFQVNRVKRILKKITGISPENSIPIIKPHKKLNVFIYHYNGLLIPLSTQKPSSSKGSLN